MCGEVVWSLHLTTLGWIHIKVIPRGALVGSPISGKLSLKYNVYLRATVAAVIEDEARLYSVSWRTSLSHRACELQGQV